MADASDKTEGPRKPKEPPLPRRPSYDRVAENLEKWANSSGLRKPTLSVRGRAMTIYRILQNSAFGPEEIERLVAAYEQTLAALGLKDRTDPITELVAKKIVAIAQTGVRDPLQLARRAISELGSQ